MAESKLKDSNQEFNFRVTNQSSHFLFVSLLFIPPKPLFERTMSGINVDATCGTVMLSFYASDLVVRPILHWNGIIQLAFVRFFFLLFKEKRK